MEEKKLLEGDAFKGGKYKLAFVDGKLVASLDYDSGIVDGAVQLKLDGEAVIDALAELIPGESAIEKSVALGLKAFLKKA